MNCNSESCIALIMDRRWLTILLSLLVMLGLASGARYIVAVDVDVRNHFSADDPHIIALEQLEKTYALSDAALVAVAPRDGSIFTPEALVAIEELTEQLWLTPYVTRVDSIANYSHSQGIEDELIVEQLVDDAGSLSDGDIERIKRIALGTEEVAGRFVSRDGRVAGLVVSVALPENRELGKSEVTEFLYDTAVGARAKYPNIDYHLTGEIILNRAMRDAIDDDMGVLGPIALGTMLLISILLLRSLWGTVAIILMLVAVMLSALGFTGWTGMKLFGESGAALFVLMAVTVAHSVHIIEAMRAGLRQGMDRKQDSYAFSASQRVACFPYVVHDCNRFPQSEFRGNATVSGHGKHRGVRSVVRLRLFGDIIARVSVSHTHARRARACREIRFFRSFRAVCRFPPHDPAMLLRRSDCCAHCWYIAD